MSAPHLLRRNILQYQNRRIHCIREGRMMLTFLTGFHQQNIATLFAMEVANKSGKCCDFWRQYQLQGHFFPLRTETKFWSHSFTYVFAVLGKNVYSQNTKIFISGVQTAQELLRQIHRITLKKKSTPLQTLPFILSANSHQMFVWNLITLLFRKKLLMYTHSSCISTICSWAAPSFTVYIPWMVVLGIYRHQANSRSAFTSTRLI